MIGGAEYLAREVCRRLAPEHEVTVLTSCALDYRDWENHFPAGEEEDEGIRVLRFPVSRNRDWERFGRHSSLLYAARKIIPLPRFVENHWLKAQGPYCPELPDQLERLSASSDLTVFFSCLYYPTVAGIRRAAGNSVLVPTAHDEPALDFSIYLETFSFPSHLVFLSPEEQELVNRKFDLKGIRQRIAGFGVDIPDETDKQDGGYFLYLGRIEEGKKCGELFSWALKAGLNLKAAGPAFIALPSEIDYRGIVPQEEKKQLLSGAKAIIIPSPNESLSITALEAWACGKPIIASSSSPVLAGQVGRSGGGLVYSTFQDFVEASRSISPEMGSRGRDFVRDKYSWDVVISEWKDILEDAARSTISEDSDIIPSTI